MTRALWHCANVVFAIGLAIALAPFVLAAAIHHSWRWVELRAVYGGDEAQRDRDEWRET